MDDLTSRPTGRHVAADDVQLRILIHHAPTPLWYVDLRAVGEAFEQLRARGVTDIAAYLDAHPELVETAKDIVLVTEVSQAAMALFRSASAKDLIGPVRYLFAATPAMARRVMIAHFDGRRNYVEQARMTTFDGEVRDVIFSVTYPTPGEPQDTAFITIEDVTDSLRTQAQLRRLQTDFAHAARLSMLGELAAAIAHEVKQPLAAIVTNAETSLRWLSRGEPNLAKVRELTARVAASAGRASDIIQRVQAMATKQDPHHIPLDLAEVVDEALHFVSHELDGRGIELSRTQLEALPTILGDRIQLQQVVVNLLVNAIQAIGEGAGRERRIELELGLEPSCAVMLAIRDTGPGVAAGDLRRVFDGFFTTKNTGVGIGLSVCQSIVAEHGGRISVSNHPAGGAMFQVRLPIVPAPEA
ncbi:MULTISPECIES: sensor histidine kinase [Phenylobacterium]|uniref:histidine kinase n=1 Tax=Phenylobacterium koreense TaxID=266125 RepID=A0ABV2EEW1_9CAUL